MTNAQQAYTAKPTVQRFDATDRRHIEALNEDKSHTTKAALDDGEVKS